MSLRAKLTLVTCQAMVFSACWFGVMYRPDYEFAIDEVEANQGTASSSARPDNATHYEDEWLGWDWSVGRRRIELVTSNRTDGSVLIRWDLATLTAVDGETDQLVDRNVPYENRSQPKQATQLESGSRSEESVYPAGFLHWEEEQIVHWLSKTLVPQLPGIATSDRDKAEEFARQQLGKKLLVTIPVERGTESRSYTFTLSVQSYSVVRIVGT